MKQRIFPFIRMFFAAIVFILCILALLGKAYPIKIFDIQFSALAQHILVNVSLFAVILMMILIILTLLLGRLYCSTLCPLGIFQEILMLLMYRRRTHKEPNNPYKYWIAAISFGALIGGTIVVLRLIDPYTVFGSAVSLSWFGIGFCAALAVLVWFKGRFFCANICPVGTILGLLAKHGLCRIYIKEDICRACGNCMHHCPVGCIDIKNKKVNNETCIKCLHCLGACHFSAMRYGRPSKEQAPFDMSRRKFLALGGAVAVVALAVKGGVELGKTVARRVKNVILPPGAGNAQDFANRCLNCNLCAQNCPMKIIKKADEQYPAVHIDYQNGFCKFNCNKCSQICPSGALKRLTLAEKQKTRLALAVINPDICIRCGLCAQECPRHAIDEPGEEAARVNSNRCIGCGLCKNVCPVQAIALRALDQQKTLS